MSNTIKCSVLLKKAANEKNRRQCSRQATHIRRIVGARVAIVECDYGHGDNPDIADAGFVDLADLPLALRKVAAGHIERQMNELDMEAADIAHRRAKLAEELDLLLNMNVVGPAEGQPTKRL